MHIKELKENFVIFPLNIDFINNEFIEQFLQNKYLKGFLKFNELLVGTFFRGIPILGKNDISSDVEVILLEKNNGYIMENIDKFLSYNKKIYFFDKDGKITKCLKFNLKSITKPIFSFVLFYDYYTLSRISSELSEYHRVAFIARELESMQIDENSFDDVVYFDTIEELYELLDKLNSKIIFTKALIGHYKKVADLVQRYVNVVVDSTDIPQFFSDNKKERELFFDGESEFIAIEEICKNAKKFLVRYSEEELKTLKSFSSKDNILTWYEYTNKVHYSNYKRELKEPYSLVWAGILQPLSYPKKFKGRYLLESAKIVSNQNMRFTFMLPPSFSTSMLMVKSDRDLYYEFFYEAKLNENIDIHFGDIPQKAIKLLEKYHFGVFPLIQEKDRKFYRNIIPSKFALYLEAGLPIIVNDCMIKLSSVVKEYNLGIVVSNDNVKDLKKIIDKKRDEYPLMQENIIKFRESFCYENRVNDLLKEIV